MSEFTFLPTEVSNWTKYGKEKEWWTFGRQEKLSKALLALDLLDLTF